MNYDPNNPRPDIDAEIEDLKSKGAYVFDVINGSVEEVNDSMLEILKTMLGRIPGREDREEIECMIGKICFEAMSRSMVEINDRKVKVSPDKFVLTMAIMGGASQIYRWLGQQPCVHEIQPRHKCMICCKEGTQISKPGEPSQ